MNSGFCGISDIRLVSFWFNQIVYRKPFDWRRNVKHGYHWAVVHMFVTRFFFLCFFVDKSEEDWDDVILITVV